MKIPGTICIAAALVIGFTTASVAADIPYRRSVTLKVGQSIILKGVRARCNRNIAPAFDRLRKLPSSRLGILMDGGAGTVKSNRCGKRVPARAIKFRATRRGTETLDIYRDRIKIVVR